MVGLCGTTGKSEHSMQNMSQKLHYNDYECNYKYLDEKLKIEIVQFKKSFTTKPLVEENESLIGLWGDIYSYEGENKKTKKDHLSDVKYFSDKYRKHGFNFLKNINGEFAGVIYDKENEKLHLISDPLSTHPIFYTRTENKDLVFSTQLQSLPLHPSVKTSFDLKYLYQFFTYERVLGNKTPLKNIEQVHPGSVLSYDLNSKKIKNDIYWTPQYNPRKRNYSKVVREFIDLFKDVVRGRIDEDLSYGLYLSGGSDSRLILATLRDLYPDLDLTCYHMNERMNREAKIAKKVAEKSDFDFVLLRRDEDYLKKVLEEYSPISLLSGWFSQVHSLGFIKKIKNEVDVIFNGLNAGTILQRGHTPKKRVKIPYIGYYFYFPKFPDISSIEDFIDIYIGGNGAIGRKGKIPSYLKGLKKRDFISSFQSEFSNQENCIKCHGVRYASFDDFFHSFSFYPITNDQGYIAYHSEVNSMATEFPFMDRRIVNFSLRLPEKFLLQKNLVNSAIKEINPQLAKIKHPSSGIPLKYSWNLQFLGKKLDMAKKKLFPSQKWEGPWGDVEEKISEDYFVKEKIYENKDFIKNCRFLDWDKILKCYSKHRKCKNRKEELLSLLTFIENPLKNMLND